jgi:hypothetical protein
LGDGPGELAYGGVQSGGAEQQEPEQPGDVDEESLVVGAVLEQQGVHGVVDKPQRAGAGQQPQRREASRPKPMATMGRVDPADPVPAGRPGAHQPHQGEADQRAAGQVEGVGQRRERRRLVQHPLIQRIGEIADADRAQPGGQQPLQPRTAWPVHPDPDQQPGHAGQADGDTGARLSPVVGEQEVASDRHHPGHEIDPPHARPHVLLSSAEPLAS